MSERSAHWEDVWSSKRPDETSWHQEDASSSVRLFDALGLSAGRSVVDVGGGASPFAGAMLDRGHDVTVADIAAAALARGRERLGPRADDVSWLAADVTRDDLGGPYDVWHDRAVFHFLVDADARAAYLDRLRAALAPGGHVILATFALDGPDSCSGLPVRRYDAAELMAELGDGFRLVASEREVHQTPWGSDQAFTYVVAIAQP